MPTKFIKEIVEFFGKKLDAVGVELKGVSVVTIKGDKGDTGDQGIPGKDGSDGADSKVPGPKGDPGVDGTNGRDGKDSKVPGPKGDRGDVGPAGVRGKDGLKGKAGADGSPDTGEDILKKINKDKTTLIKRDKVEGLDEIERRARTAEANSQWRGGGGSFVYAHDISASLNGVLKTFTLVANAKVISVFASSFPGVFRPTTDYTTTSSTITFTSEITAASTLAAGQTVIILYKIL